jgi:lysophospholipase L1-like esterase
MKQLLIAALLLCVAITVAQPVIYKLSDTTPYTPERGHGYDILAAPEKGSNKPFFYSIRVPDGNYKITVRLGNKKKAGSTTVRAESRRLVVEELRTSKGEFVEQSFIVNKRTPDITLKEKVKIKDREKLSFTWDDKLTLEFNGDAPQCESFRIEPADSSVVTVFLCGNSTVVDQSTEPWASWGQMIPAFFTEKVAFANYAESGESANTFIGAGRLKKALTQMKAGDYVLIEFGHNDQKQNGPGRGAWYSYMTSLKIFIDEAHALGAHPVLITPTQRRRFDEKGHNQNTHGEFPDAMRWLANKENIPLIDLNKLTKVLYEALGEEKSKKAFVHYPANTFPGQTAELADNTHFSTYGAYQVAKCVITGMIQACPELTINLKPGFSYLPALPDDPESFRWHLSPFFDREKPDGD